MRDVAFVAYVLGLLVSAVTFVLALAFRRRIRDWWSMPVVSATRDLAASNDRLAVSYDNLAAALRDAFPARKAPR